MGPSNKSPKPPNTVNSSHTDHLSKKPAFFSIRSHTLFICSTVGVGLFTDLFLYGLVVPILPFILKERVHLPESQIQSHVSYLLATYAASSVVLSPFAGAVADRTSSRQLPFLAGLTALMLATALLFIGSSVPVLVVARVAQGASSAFVWTVGLALCIDTVGPQRLGITTGTIFSFISVGELFAPVLGGVLYEKAGNSAVAALALGMLVVDFLMRVLVIEKKVAARYVNKLESCQEDYIHVDEHNCSNENSDAANEGSNTETLDESSPLLRKDTSSGSPNDGYYIQQENRPAILRAVPILHCFRSPSLILTQVIALMQAIILAGFDATIPTHAHSLFGFTSLKASLLFVPLGLLNVIIGPIAGWAVDRFGTKPAAVIGYAYLVPALALLRIPTSEPMPQQSILYGGLLALCGVGMAIIGAPSTVEAGAVVDRFHKRNPEVFGEQGPYAQLYGFNSMVFSAGLSVGPLAAGHLREQIGYGNMNAVLAAMSGITAAACYVWFGGKPKLLWNSTKRGD